MSDNAMRRNLITKFNCTNCGGLLMLSYELKDGVKLDEAASYYEPPRTAMVTQHIFIEPCSKCTSDAEKSIQRIRDVLGSTSKGTES